MYNIKIKIINILKTILYNRYKKKIKIDIIFNINYNKFGDININLLKLFPFIKPNKIKKNAFILGRIIKKKLYKYIEKFKIINNFLNLFFNNNVYIRTINNIIKKKYKIYKLFNKEKIKKDKIILIEFSSPNLNKPLHLGHLRNILIGNTITNIYKVLGYKVIKSQLINDRGIHISKCIAIYKNYKKFIEKNKNKIKGDYLIGYLYFKFEKKLKNEIKYLSKKYKNKNYNFLINKSKLLKIANKILIKWENKNNSIINIWNIIKELVFRGFEETYKKLNITFDEILYESNTYLLGKTKILKGVKKKIFKYDNDNSIYFIYNNKKNILLRKNGTSLYLTQEIGTLLYRLKKYKRNLLKLIYVVGNEQINHFKIFFKILKSFKLNIYKKLYHLSYNSVNFLNKKIKSRNLKYKNKLIFIDDLIKIINKNVKKFIKINPKNKKIELISLGAIKYQFLKINPNKIIDFNLNKILEIKGNTGIYIQYTYARILSILKKNKVNKRSTFYKIKNIRYILLDNEKYLIKLFINYYKILLQSKNKMDPSILINYFYKLTKVINNFYDNNKIIKIKLKKVKKIKLIICIIILKFLSLNMKILGIPILNNI